MTNRYAPILAAALMLCSCNLIGSLVHDDQVVAKAGGQRLYLSELEKYIPRDSSPEDSAALAQQFINSWAMDRLFEKTAKSHLTKEEKNVDQELELYRSSLLRYRYEQRYINDRLDTLITRDQLEEYHKTHKEALELPRPILKLRFVDIMSDSPNYGEIMEKLSSEGGQALKDLDSLAQVSALRYFDKSGKWTDAAVAAREFGTDYGTMLTHLKGDRIVFEYADRGEVRAAWVAAILRGGQAPLDYCESVIRDNILSERKRDLLNNLEQDLLTNAKEKKDFVIYQNE